MMSNKNNSSEELTGGEIASLVVLPTIGIFSIFGNTILIYLVLTTPNKRDFVNYFVFSLALVDMVTAIGIIPLQCLQIAGVFSAEDYACVTVVFFILTVALASVCTLLAVTFERHLTIAKPFHRTNIKHVKRMVVGTIVGIWVYSIAIASLVIVPGINAPAEDIDGKTCGMYNLVDSRGYSFFILSNFVIPLPIMVILYGHIFVIARRQLRAVVTQVHPRTADSTTVRMRIIKREFRIAMVLFFITAYYIVSWLAVFALVAVFFANPTLDQTITNMEILIYFNAAINPWIYAWANKALRKHLIRLITGRRDDPRRYLNVATTRQSMSSLSTSVSWSRRNDSDILTPGAYMY